ncbi:MAG: 4-hydroxythreonine-4-phosphate dehydrogenase PdxA [Proteobacteria bacterium]|nr:4-hydroxythreonine-4-phosphate dehydrogenase PdxA [Pseudomonadota bacterium]
MAFQKKDLQPKIAITMGDPRGIGPEVVLKAFARLSHQRVCVPLVLGDFNILTRTAQALNLKLKVVEVAEGFRNFQPESVPVLSLSRFSGKKSPADIPFQESSRAAFAYVEKAAHLAVTGKVQAIVTAPVSKEAISRVGISFRGHTEYLAEASGTEEFVMMLAGQRLKVALVTTHLPLREVSGLVQAERICSVIEITNQGLQDYFEVNHPRIAVAGLNPHAGENGLFGEEELIISQAVRRVSQKGLFVSGPWPADTLFYRAKQGEFDAVVCMYHDQGLIPLKLLHFEDAVNITLGLPFIRTSVDHGVAYDIAGKNRANARSMQAAIQLAAQMATKKRKSQNLKTNNQNEEK